MRLLLFLLSSIPFVSSVNWIFPWQPDPVIRPRVTRGPRPIVVTPTPPPPPVRCGPLSIPSDLSLHVAKELSEVLLLFFSIFMRILGISPDCRCRLRAGRFPRRSARDDGDWQLPDPSLQDPCSLHFPPLGQHEECHHRCESSSLLYPNNFFSGPVNILG